MNETQQSHELTSVGSQPHEEAPAIRHDEPVLERVAISIIERYFPYPADRQKIAEHMKKYPYHGKMDKFAGRDETFCLYETTSQRWTIVGIDKVFETDWEAKNYLRPRDVSNHGVRMFTGDRNG